MRFLIIGGSDVGIAAGLRTHELDPSNEITLVLADEFPTTASADFRLSRRGDSRLAIAGSQAEFRGINLLPSHTAESIGPKQKTVRVRRVDGAEVELAYDKLLIGTGARPVRAAMEGLDLPGLFPLPMMQDSFAVHRF